MSDSANGVQKAVPGLGRRSAEVLSALRNDLLEGVFPEGGALPTERELCERFDASRPTIRRATARLVEDGLIVVRQGAGMFVRSTSAAGAPGSKTISVMAIYEGELLLTVQKMVLAKGHLLCAYSQGSSYWDPKQERLFLQRVKEERHKGIVAFCSPVGPTNEDALRELVGAGVRVVHIEHYSTDLPAQPYIVCDYRRAGYAAAVELMIAGCEDVAYVAMAHSPYEELLERGLTEALGEHGHGYDPRKNRFDFPAGRFSEDPKTLAQARSKIEAFVKSAVRKSDGRTGIFCRTLGLALAVHEAAGRHGIKVPRDLALIAFDFEEPPRDCPVDTVYVDRMASLERAIDAVAATTWSPLRELVPPTLARRGSVRASSRRRSPK